jgi:protein-tyrosine-phosphatase
MPDTHKILFVCIENSNRSQMAEAFARIHGKNRIEAYSAGSRPGKEVNPKAIASMLEIGYDLLSHRPKSLEESEKMAPFDVVVLMGCGDSCPTMPAGRTVEWNIPDPKFLEPNEFNLVRDRIEREVKELLRTL